MRLYSVYCTSVCSSTCFGCWHPTSAAGTAVITDVALVKRVYYKWLQSNIVGHSFNSIHDARTHECKIHWSQTGKRALPNQKHQKKTIEQTQLSGTTKCVVDPVGQCQKLYEQLYQLLMLGVNSRNMYSCIQKCNKLNTVAFCWTVIECDSRCTDPWI